jgi:hypothetical protein
MERINHKSKVASPLFIHHKYSMKRFYVYAFLRENGTPYYIGKGTGKRIYQNTGRKGTKRPVNGGTVVKIKEHLTEEEAFELERTLILFYGRKCDGGILHNFSEGGQGGNNLVGNLTEEHKKKIGEGVCQRVIVKGIEFKSKTEAAEHFGICRQALWKWKQKGLVVEI